MTTPIFCFMKYLFAICFLLFTSCSNRQETTATRITDSTQSDTVVAVADTAEPSHATPADTVAPVKSIRDTTDISGRHALTLQWISWDRPGHVHIEKADSGWYTVKGAQRDEEGNYLTIDGRLRVISKNELRFAGTIVSKEDGVNNGKPCVREGEQTFLSTRGRRYWRLQQMLNCEGNYVTDYIDIYF